MATDATEARKMRDHELNEALETQRLDELGGLSMQNQRLARVQEYEEAAASRADPLAAVIGLGNAYFQRIFEHLGTAILDVIDSRPHTLEELRPLAPEIRLLVKLRNAIETDLAVQDLDVGHRAASFPPGANGKGFKAATSKRDLLPKGRTGGTSF